MTETTTQTIQEKFRLPVKITPSPILEASTEIRFDSTFPTEAIFGLIYNEFSSTYKDLEKLPILQIPEPVRSKDVNLMFQPQYRLRKENFLIHIGAKSISFSVQDPYPGWAIYLDECMDVLSRMNDLNFIKSATRFGLRYVDFFDDDIFGNIRLQIKLNDAVSLKNEVFLKTVIVNEDLRSNLQIGNSIKLKSQGLEKKGSVIDIDTYIDIDTDMFFEQIHPFLDKAHKYQKELFFSLLTPEFLATLNPTY